MLPCNDKFIQECHLPFHPMQSECRLLFGHIRPHDESETAFRYKEVPDTCKRLLTKALVLHYLRFL